MTGFHFSRMNYLSTQLCIADLICASDFGTYSREVQCLGVFIHLQARHHGYQPAFCLLVYHPQYPNLVSMEQAWNRMGKAWPNICRVWSFAQGQIMLLIQDILNLNRQFHCTHGKIVCICLKTKMVVSIIYMYVFQLFGSVACMCGYCSKQMQTILPPMWWNYL